MIMPHYIRWKSVASKLFKLRYINVRKFSQERSLEENAEILRILLGCSHEESSDILSKNVPLQKLDHGVLERSIQMLKKFGIQPEEIKERPQVMFIHPATIEHHSMVLEEGGFQKISVTLLTSYFQIIKKRISLLKAHKLISAETDVLESFLSYLEPIPAHISPISHDAFKTDSTMFRNVYDAVLRHYLMWRLEIGPEELNRICRTHARIKHRSLRHLRRTLQILEEDLGFTKEKICKNGYLIHSHPDNVLNTLQNIESLGGMEIKSVLEKYPKIAMVSTDTLIKTNQYLKEFGIPDSAIQRCMHIFTLSSESVRQRLKNLKEVPEFEPLSSHPRILRLVHYQHKALTRLDYLQEQRVRCASLHLLSAPRAYFEKYTNIGEDRTRGLDIVHYLGDTLGISSSVLRKDLSHHNLWYHVPLLVVSTTLNFLLDKGFTKEEVGNNIQLLLYPRERVEQELEMLPKREEIVQAQELCSQKTGEVPAITPNIRLALCLYYIERVHHFSGDGIWSGREGETEPTNFEVTFAAPKQQRASQISVIEDRVKNRLSALERQ
ncbi:transcription termination factor 5, mitochondrial [Anabrus simplex]|uniref:transcription termination factor 5, mitochondrial n=1 Tax=Anabrus simplex TaxID=316456 RepID=UPI0035A2A91C